MFSTNPRRTTSSEFQVLVHLPNGGTKTVAGYYDSSGRLQYVNPAEVPPQRCRRCDRRVAIWHQYCEGC